MAFYLVLRFRRYIPLMVRLQRSQRLRGKAAIQRTGKAKSEGWWLVVGREDIDELLALKRVMIRDTTTCTVEFQVPQEPGNYTLQIYLISDTFCGVDRKREFQLVVGEAEEEEEEDEDDDAEGEEGGEAGSGDDNDHA
mmetsp:Transcript_35096/g.59437  ORF Transcript_35096/g.59437 Transcript_35096/m.59437 type:complete len:138 (+) Transcript_35096:591-1004(+)